MRKAPHPPKRTGAMDDLRSSVFGLEGRPNPAVWPVLGVDRFRADGKKALEPSLAVDEDDCRAGLLGIDREPGNW